MQEPSMLKWKLDRYLKMREHLKAKVNSILTSGQENETHLNI